MDNDRKIPRRPNEKQVPLYRLSWFQIHLACDWRQQITWRWLSGYFAVTNTCFIRHSAAGLVANFEFSKLCNVTEDAAFSTPEIVNYQLCRQSPIGFWRVKSPPLNHVVDSHSRYKHKHLARHRNLQLSSFMKSIRSQRLIFLLFSVSLMLHFTHNLMEKIDKGKMIGLVMLLWVWLLFNYRNSKRFELNYNVITHSPNWYHSRTNPDW